MMSPNLKVARDSAHCFLLQVEEKENAQGSVTPRPSDQPSKPLVEPAENQNEVPALLQTWEAQCQKCLGPSRAIAVLKAAGIEE